MFDPWSDDLLAGGGKISHPKSPGNLSDWWLTMHPQDVNEWLRCLVCLDRGRIAKGFYKSTIFARKCHDPFRLRTNGNGCDIQPCLDDRGPCLQRMHPLVGRFPRCQLDASDALEDRRPRSSGSHELVARMGSSHTHSEISDVARMGSRMGNRNNRYCLGTKP